MMTNKRAAAILHKAITTLLLAHSGAPKSEKPRLLSAAKALKMEYDTVLGRSPALTYLELTGRLSNAAKRLKSIADERDNLANSLVSAATILDAITKVLGLLTN